MNYPSIHIHRVPMTERLRVQTCHDCGKRRRFLQLIPESLYYGPDWICGGCGRRWSDGEWMPFQFSNAKPLERDRNIARVKAAWGRER